LMSRTYRGRHFRHTELPNNRLEQSGSAGC
jgi:hypothetical protein